MVSKQKNLPIYAKVIHGALNTKNVNLAWELKVVSGVQVPKCVNNLDIGTSQNVANGLMTVMITVKFFLFIF